MEDTVADTGNKSGGDQSMRGGGVPRRRCGSGFRSLLKAELYPSSLDPIAAINVPAGSWTAFNIALSALFYLFDFATDLLTLRTYYYYSVLCPKYIYNSSPRPAPLDLPHECNVIMEGLSFRTVFYVCISLMAAAHLSNTLIFWVTLDPSEHPLRLAYFLPLIHLSRLLKVLWRTGTCGGSLEDVQDRGQKESSSLYNVLAASLETAPQLMLQFHVFCQLGERDGYGNEVPERVPKTLIVSLVASLVSGTYTGSVAVLSLLQKRAGIMEPQLRRWTACIGMLAGLHILSTAMSTQTLITAALAESIIALWIYLFIVVVVTWIFFAFLLKKSQHDSHTNMRGSNHKWRKRWMIQGVHSLALAHVSLFIGPMYVIVKLFDKPTCFLVWGTLLHIFVELLGFGAVVAPLGFKLETQLRVWGITCRRPSWRGVSESNVYLTCNVFLEAVCPLILALLVSTLVFANMVAKFELQLAATQDEQQLAVSDAVSNQLMEICIAPIEYNMPNTSTVDPELGSPHHIHSLITTTSCDESPLVGLLPSSITGRPAMSSFVAISFVALFIKRIVLHHHKI